MRSEINIFLEKLEKTTIFQPILFLWENKDLLNYEVENIINSICEKYNIPKITVKKIIDNNESIKIEEIRNFMSFADLKSNYKFNIFFIENINRLTTQSANAMLKFLEEPPENTIIFLTNKSIANVLDTILSRVLVIDLFIKENKKNNLLYEELIKNYFYHNQNDLIYYFYNNQKKLEKEDYILFLEILLDYSIKNNIFKNIYYIYENINKLKNSQANPKYIIDNILLKI